MVREKEVCFQLKTSRLTVCVFGPLREATNARESLCERHLASQTMFIIISKKNVYKNLKKDKDKSGTWRRQQYNTSSNFD
jgi:hypothetical protein